MKVRDIKQYREKVLVKRDDIDYNTHCLGEKDEPLLKDFYGSGKNIDNIVGQISKFAKNTQTQIFYEFLQNADDAKASKLAITFNKDWFLVVNNGEPFKTDGTEALGQLRSFLNKEDSEKAFDDESIGKYGLGSKLLYDLLTNQDAAEKKNERLTEAIITNLKSPILFSWASIEQWNELKYWKKNDAILLQDCKATNAPLLTKILYAYYPAYFQEKKKLRDGTEKELFSASDVESLQSLFFGNENEKNCFFNKQSEFSFEKGTAILIPLGEGVAKNLDEAINETLKERLATSLSFLKKTKKIFINDELIKPIHKEEFTINLQYQGKKKDKIGNYQAHTFDVKILLPTNINTINDAFCNFYQFLPISNETQGLGFVINAEELELIQNRQEVDWDTYSQSRIKIIGEKLIEKLEVIAQNDKPLYFHFLKCFAKAKGNFLEEYLENHVKEFLLKNLPSNTNQNVENIKIKSTSLNINPSNIGLDLHWLDESFEDNYEDFEAKFELKKWTISDLFDETEEENVRDWIRNLSATGYKVLLSELKSQASFPFIKTSKDNVISKSELKSSENIIPLTSKTKDLKAIFDVQGIEYTDVALLEFENLLPKIEILERLKKEIEKIKTNLNENQKYTIFKTFKAHFEGEEKKLAIFKNRAGIFYTLGALIKNDITLAPSGILYDFQIDPTEPYFEEYDGYFMPNDKIWKAIKENWGRVNLNADNFTQIIADFNKLIGLDDTKTKLDKSYNWILCSDGTSTNKDEVFYAKSWADEITENDYTILSAFMMQITDYKIVTYSVLKQLQNVNFADLPTFGISSIQQKIKENVEDFNLSFEEIQVLNDIKGSSSLFDNFIILGDNENQTYEVKIKKSGDIQFYTSDANVNSFLSEKDNYFLLPKSLLELLKTDSYLKTETDAFLQNLITNFGANPVLIDLVVKSNENKTKTDFLSKCEISLKTDADIENYTDEYEGKAIKLMLKEDNWVASYKNKITIDNKAFSHYNYKEEVTGGFKLSELLPEYRGISDVLAAIKSKLHHSLHKIFETIPFPSQNIENEIIRKKDLQNPEQLSFITYHRNKENKPKNLSDFNIEALENDKILTSLFNHKLICFSQFSNGKGWFALQNHIDTESNLFTEEEKTPDWIKQWVNNDEKKSKFLKDAGLLYENSGIFIFRSNLDKNQGAKEHIDKILEDGVWSNDTQTWLSTRFTACMERSGAIYNTIQSFFDKYCEKYAAIQNLFQLQVEQDKIKVKIVPYNILGYAVNDIGKELKIVWKDVVSKNDYAFYDTNNAENISKKISQEAKIEGKFVETDTISEWKNDYRYEKWRDEIINKRYQIFFSPTELPFEYTLQLGSQKEIIKKDYKNGLRAKVEKDNVRKLYIFEENGKNKRKLLIEYRDDLFSPAADDLTKLLELDYETPNNPEKNNDNFPTQSGKDGDIKAPDWNEDEKTKFERFREQLKMLVNDEEMEEILSDPEKLKKALEKLKKEPKINPISGYIGERLIYEWQQFGKEEIVVWHEDKSAYDLRLKYLKEDYHIEVKTTTGSMREKNATSAIFFRELQEDAVVNERYANYFLVQIGLKDLGLYGFYKQFRNEDLKDLKDIKEEINNAVKEIMTKELVEKIKKNRIRYRLTEPENMDDPFS